MTTLLDLDARVSALEGGDAMFGTVESLTKSPTATQTNFGASASIVITSTNLYPAPIAGDVYRIHQAGLVFHDAPSGAHTVGFTIILPSPAGTEPGIVGYTTIPANVEGRYYRLDATVVCEVAGAAGQVRCDSLMFFSEPLTPHGWPFGTDTAVPIEITAPPQIVTMPLSIAMDLREPTLNIMGGIIFGAVDAHMIVIPRIHYVERLANRGA